MKHILIRINILIALFISISSLAKTTIEIKHQDGDMTEVVRNAIEGNTDKELTIVFEKGKYLFLADFAVNNYSYITNHSNGLKKIIFLLEGYDSVAIEGNGSEFIFHGQVAPFQIKNCKKVTVKNLSIDWDIPFVFQSRVVAVNQKESYVDVKPFSKGFSWSVEKDRISFPNVDGFSFFEMGSTLEFDSNEKRAADGALDYSLGPRWVEVMGDSIIRIHDRFRKYPEIGNILNSKGEGEQNRYAPAFQYTNSQNILLEGIIVHHALGMGFLFERSQDIVIKKCGVYVREGADRVVSTIADATHFSNCKGAILIEDCTFKQMLDDGTNVHGTYVEVNKIIDKKTLVVELKHKEQMGFEFASAGDEVWIIMPPSPDRAAVNVVAETSIINDRFIKIRFKEALPVGLKNGAILENKTWNPTFTMRGCTIKDHRARNVIIKTPLKIIIENNNFSSMMSAIQLRGESFFWYESGAVNDVLIRNNHFTNCCYGGAEAAILYITPRLGKVFDSKAIYDKNIRFENNTIESSSSRVVWADRVAGLTIANNTIIQKTAAHNLYPLAPIFEFVNCKDVEITNNKYEGANKNGVKMDASSKKTVTQNGNVGF